MYFLRNSSFRLAKTKFLSSEKSIFLFRAFLKLLKFGVDNSCLWKLIFWLVELIFSHFSDTPPSESYFPSSLNVFLNEFSSRMVETHFLSCENRFLLFILFFHQWKQLLKLVQIHFFGGKTLFPSAERDFLSSENCLLIFCASFLQVKTVRETSWNK